MQLKELKLGSGGHLGVAVLDTATGQIIENRLDERFALCSTFKALAIAFTLARVDRGEEKLDRRIFFGEKDLIIPFKATKPHITDGMTIEELCEAAAVVSDSTAANLLLSSFGGPSALTAYLRSIGDQTTRIDKTELTLNIVKPGETHDTTSPRGMVGTLQRIILGSALSPKSRAYLTGWMMASRDAAAQRLRAGLPAGWRIANKPGTWEGIATNDIGVIFPPNRSPIVVAAYLGKARGSVADQEAVLAEAARIVTRNA
ncbi:class A beta-lactamase [Rhizobium oryzicola]|uniref:Beta-lactamase n=1 Tax=Rhizobium oryzicola TaxID=1232668 RepID=A0ABT8T4D7_9HYPH|nr:class A beta-lactamase [Rhizobium oryzicola]MDO1585430.1 class A beta-lactamase [Rhizobium oryzicola]